MTVLPCLPDAPDDVKRTLEAVGNGGPLRGAGGQAGWCQACMMPCTPGRPDPCLGWLPGCSQACCGHGDPQRATITIGGTAEMPGVTQPWRIILQGDDALAVIEIIRRHREHNTHADLQWHLDEAAEAERQAETNAAIAAEEQQIERQIDP